MALQHPPNEIKEFELEVFSILELCNEIGIYEIDTSPGIYDFMDHVLSKRQISCK